MAFFCARYSLDPQPDILRLASEQTDVHGLRVVQVPQTQVRSSQCLGPHTKL